MKKKIALALLLSTFSIGTIYVMDGNGQSGAFPPSGSEANPGLSYFNDQQPPQYTGPYYFGFPYFVPVATQPSASSSSSSTGNVNCCVVGDNCCHCRSNDNDECDTGCPSCPVNVSISPLVNAALNLFNCGATGADEDPSARQLRELQKRNPEMNPAVALLAAGSRVVTKEHKE